MVMLGLFIVTFILILWYLFGDSVERSQVIGQVGPLYVYDVVNNPYKDKTGRPTNGSTTGCHLHFSIKIKGSAVNPLDFFD